MQDGTDAIASVPSACKLPRAMIDAVEPAKLEKLWRKPQVVRLLVIALFAEIGYAVLNISTMPVYLTVDRHLGAATVGMVLTAFLLSEAIFKSSMGHLADKYGRKQFMVLGPCITIVTSVLSLFVPHNAG